MDKRLLAFAKGHIRWLAVNVGMQWLGLCGSILMACTLGYLATLLLEETFTSSDLASVVGLFGFALCLRVFASYVATKASFHASSGIKRKLRETVFEKLLEIGPSYTQDHSTSELVQVASEGIDQLEIFFGKYLPQLFYAILAPLTLFVVVYPLNPPSALVLLVVVPLIPVCIGLVQGIAGKLFKRYWGSYTEMGDIFLENIQGMTTLKINQADAHYHEKMNTAAERFRVITMNVLKMQLNSIIVMDLVAYGGAAVGIIVAITQYSLGALSFGETIVIIVLAAEFFIPMRMLGAYFHVAMNGMSASKKVFSLLDRPTPECKKTPLCPGQLSVSFDKVAFSYDSSRSILEDLTLKTSTPGMIGIVGLSGSGKSTIVGLLSGQLQGYSGSIQVGDVELRDIDTPDLLARTMLVSNSSYLFAGSVASNLLMANPHATDAEMRSALARVSILEYFDSQQGLDTRIAERAANLSGGQRQRLALARALLSPRDLYLFDEATSNIDPESEEIILQTIHELAQRHTVIVISHRLACVKDASCIYLINEKQVAEQGTHQELMTSQGLYARLYQEQSALESFGRM